MICISDESVAQVNRPPVSIPGIGKKQYGVLAPGANDSGKTKAEKPGKETPMFETRKKKGRGKGRHSGR